LQPTPPAGSLRQPRIASEAVTVPRPAAPPEQDMSQTSVLAEGARTQVGFGQYHRKPEPPAMKTALTPPEEQLPPGAGSGIAPPAAAGSPSPPAPRLPAPSVPDPAGPAAAGEPAAPFGALPEPAWPVAGEPAAPFGALPEPLPGAVAAGAAPQTLGGAYDSVATGGAAPRKKPVALLAAAAAAVVVGVVITVVLVTRDSGPEEADEPVAAAAKSATGAPEQSPSASKAEPSKPPPEGMVAVAGGTYVIGCDKSVNKRKCWPDEQPAHKVVLKPFAIMRQEVSMEDYDLCAADGVCPPAGKDKGCTWQKSGNERKPINCVSWEGAKKYCAHKGWRLPSEQEWEAAARGPKRLDFPWGADPPSCKLAVLSEGGDGCGTGGPADVGSHEADKSWAGAFDMGGNVREWTASDYGAYPGGTAEEGREGKINRGGSYLMKPEKLNAAHTRGADPPATQRPGLGFRCAVDL